VLTSVGPGQSAPGGLKSVVPAAMSGCHPGGLQDREGDPRSRAKLMDSLPLRCAPAGHDTFPVLAVPGLDPGIGPGHLRLAAFPSSYLILRSSREAASRRRSSGLSGPSFETPLAAAPQDEAERDDRITARDTLSRHGRACPGHPDAVRRGALRIVITGTSPVMTAEGAVGECQGGTAQAEPGA
jgi:hypothetical protein